MVAGSHSNIVDGERIIATEQLIRPHIRRTPVLEIEAAELGLAANRLSLKLELLQHSGSFKVRGAFANLLLRDVPPAGVAAASGGNHGAAVAYAAMKLGKKAKIFVPRISSPAKIRRIRDYGADLVVAGERYADALTASEAWVVQTGALPVHAFDQVETLLGQGTIGSELAAQAGDLDTLLVAVGGGGLVGGIAAWYAGAIRVIGVEPETAPTLTRALAAGRPVDAEAGGIAADSLAKPDRRARLSDRPASRRPRRAGRRRGDPRRPGGAVADNPHRRRARRRRRLRSSSVRPLPTGTGRACRHRG
jgi:threonine dehydratase